MSHATIDRYAVIGNPIAHSKSPAIHSAFAAQTGQRLDYGKLLVEPGGLADAVEQFRRNNGRGLNITVPFKQDAYRLATRLTPRAQLAGAVNTLLLEADGGLLGDNTDGVGLVRDLRDNHAIRISGKRVLLVGAGGAARGVIGPLLECEPEQLFIVNRTAERAVELVAHFAASATTLDGGGFARLGDAQFDLIINATAASLQGQAPPLPTSSLAADGACYDLMYAAEPTPFMRWARPLSSGPCVDGLGMLVEQAAESFYLWRGQRPDTAAIMRMLRPD
jgi:shikimate dehydrogenase